MKKLRSVKAMREFLTNHFRYNTMNSWNGSTSFAANIKVHRLDWGGKVPDNAYDFTDPYLGAYRGIDHIIREFTDKMNGRFTMGFNGKSGGYIVLYQSERKDSGYKSECQYCGQRNYAIVLDPPENKHDELFNYIVMHNHWTPETYLTQPDARSLFPDMPDAEFVEMVRKIQNSIPKNQNYTKGGCGRCHEEDGLVNLEEPLMQLSTWPGRSFGNDIEGLENDDIRWMYDIVFEFDKAVAACIKSFIDYVKSHKVEEREIFEPKTIKVAVTA